MTSCSTRDMGSYGTLTATLLLLIWHSRGGSAFSLTSNSTGIAETGKDISLDISYTTQDVATIQWSKNGSYVGLVMNATTTTTSVSPLYKDKVRITGTGSLLIINSTKNDAGNYLVSVATYSEGSQDKNFQVKVYERVSNVMVEQSPLMVDEKTAAVNLTCSASGDMESILWTRDGQTVGLTDPYILLDGSRTLQIRYPNRTHAGYYTCNVSNPINSGIASRELNVTYTDSQNAQALSGGAIAGIVIGSVLGGILLIALIVILIFCIRKKKAGAEKKPGGLSHKDVLRTVSGNTLSPDDPAYFTVNNIMYRNSSISMGSYIMNSGDNMSEYATSIATPKPPSSPPRVKHATQV